MFYSNKSSILVSGEGNSSRSKMTSFMRILNLKRILFLMCIVSSWEITWGMKENEKNEKLGSDNEEEMRRNYNVLFLGDEQVGKTQIINRYFNRPFDDDYKTTEEIDTYKKYIHVDNSQIIELSIIDTPEQGIYRPASLAFRGGYARAIVLVYDITKPDSFKHIDSWLENAPKDAVYFLVGNKTDLNGRQIQTAVAEQYAKEKNMQFFEVSAKKGDNVDELFKDIVKERLIKEKDIIKAIEEYEQKNNTNDNDNSTVNGKKTTSTTPSPTPTKNKRCSCCPCNK